MQPQPDAAASQPEDILALLRDKINLSAIPFTDRASRIMVFLDTANHGSLNVKLAERWVKREQQFGHYRSRVPIISAFHFSDDSGAPLPMACTTYPDHVDLRIDGAAASLYFLDTETLYLALPPGRSNLSMDVHVLAEDVRQDRRGGELKEGRGGRNMAYTTNAAILSNTIEEAAAGRVCAPNRARVSLCTAGWRKLASVRWMTARMASRLRRRRKSIDVGEA